MITTTTTTTTTTSKPESAGNSLLYFHPSAVGKLSIGLTLAPVASCSKDKGGDNSPYILGY